MAEQTAFQARQHGAGTLELIGIFPGMGPQHPAIIALQSLARKFRNLLFTLEVGASFEPAVLPKLIEVSGFTRLKIVTTDAVGFPFAKAGLPVFSTAVEALRRIQGEEIGEAILAKMDSVPLLHSQAFEILQQLNKSETTFQDLEHSATADPGLAMQILKTANSAFFMRRSKIETLGAALAYLGMDGIKQILIVNVFKGMSSFLQAQKAILDHGKACGHLAGFLSGLGNADRPTQGRVRLAGLLHDIGRMALAFYHPQEYLRVGELIQTEKKRTYEAETLVFGIDHQELGRRLAEKWGFPEYLARAIGDHHHVSDPAWDPLTGPVLCANGYLNQTVENIPFTPYYQKLRGFFAGRGEKMTIQELQDALKKELDRFLTEGGLALD